MLKRVRRSVCLSVFVLMRVGGFLWAEACLHVCLCLTEKELSARAAFSIMSISKPWSILMSLKRAVSGKVGQVEKNEC